MSYMGGDDPLRDYAFIISSSPIPGERLLRGGGELVEQRLTARRRPSVDRRGRRRRLCVPVVAGSCIAGV